MPNDSTSSAQSIIQLLTGFISSRIVYATIKLGITDHIADTGSTARELAQRLGVNESAIERLLRSLTGLGILHADDGGRFSLTELGSPLRADTSDSVRAYAIYVHEFLYELFEGLVGGIRTGKPIVNEMFGSPLFTYLQTNPEKADLFHAGLGNRGHIEAPAILDAYSFAGCRKIVDLGGGNGAFLSTLLRRYPEVSGVLFDRAPAIASARSGAGGPLPRCEVIEGDYFEGVPAGGDIYVLKRVLFDHTADEVKRIFRNCAGAMGPRSRLLIIEGLAGPLNEPSPAHLMEMVYLLATDGRMRTEEEYRTLLEQAGLRPQKCIRTQSEVSIIEAYLPHDVR